jgi:N-acetylneuraminic acid mutarotase
VTTSGAPTVRAYHAAVWTGSEMIVWGGSSTDDLSSVGLSDGGRYNPVGDSWKVVATVGAPSGRFNHTAVWTGTEMIVWGGLDHSQGWDYPRIGGRYNPIGDSWMEMSTTGQPGKRDKHTAVWTGSEMIVWGGTVDDNLYLNTGGHYNPAGDTWAMVTTDGAPSARYHHTAVWTGSEMIVWGGWDGYIIGGLSDGGRYNPLANSWTAVTTNSAPIKRNLHTAVWTGSEMIVWGGENGNTGILKDGGRYNPTGNNWTAVSNLGTPDARSLHTAVWTGSEMIVWGGIGLIGNSNDTWSYTPGKLMYLYQRP